MDNKVCPPWVGYFLLNPLRRLLENPQKILGQFIREGMVVLEPGCGMGFFTLPMARMVGGNGRVIAVEIQEKMLSVLQRRALKAGLEDRIEIRQSGADKMGIEDLSGKVDFSAAIHVIHEVPDQVSFLSELWSALKPEGELLAIEPKGHVSQEEFNQTLTIAEDIGFKSEKMLFKTDGRRALLHKP